MYASLEEKGHRLRVLERSWLSVTPSQQISPKAPPVSPIQTAVLSSLRCPRLHPRRISFPPPHDQKVLMGL